MKYNNSKMKPCLDIATTTFTTSASVSATNPLDNPIG